MPLRVCGYRNPATGTRDCTNERWKAGATYCRMHEDIYRAAKRAAKYAPGTVPPTPKARPSAFVGVNVTTLDPDATVDGERKHEYILTPELDALMKSAMVGATKRPAGAFIWIGPSGSGKTDGAEAIAAKYKLDFTKVDAASMTDPEAWFGTREIVVQDGVAVTDYHPSGFVESIQKPGITFIDEITRCRAEGINVLIPVLDHTRQVTNPLTGEIIHRHPQNFIIMAGNVGVNYVGTNAVDPAFWTRATKVVFDYLPENHEKKVIQEASGCDIDTAYVLVRFANDSRAKAKIDDEFTAISTREIIRAAERVADGLDRDLAVKFEVLNGVSDEGGNNSIRKQLESIWNGVRAAKDPSGNVAPKAPTASANAVKKASGSSWLCPAHGTVKVIPAGVSTKTNKPYASFKACGTFGCQNTEDNTQGVMKASATAKVLSCGDCGKAQPAGRTTICIDCGATL